MDLKVRFGTKANLLALQHRGRPRLKRFSVLSRVSRERFTFCGCLCLLNRDSEEIAWGEGLDALFPPEEVYRAFLQALQDPRLRNGPALP
jgi:hypothetical protein